MNKFIFPIAAAMLLLVSCNKEVAVTGVTVEPQSVNVYLMTTEALPVLKATPVPVDADNATITWTSDDPTAVSVDANGELTVLSKSSSVVTITATCGDFSAKCVVNVIDNFKELAEAGYGFIDCRDELGLYLVDRNLGATKVYNEDATDADKTAAIGDYYQWGNNTPAASSTAVKSTYNKEWNASGNGYSDWSVAANTPCPAGWNIPNAEQIKTITDAAFVDYDGMFQTDDEYYAALDLYEKLCLARGGYWKIEGADAAARAAATPSHYLPTAGFFWSTDPGTDSDRGFKAYKSLADNYFVVLEKKTEANIAMPIRCVKAATLK